MNKLFILLLLTAAIVFGGKFYVERQYEKELDKLIRLAKPYVDLRYKNVSIGFDGSLSLNEVSISNPSGPGSATIEKLTAITSDKFMAFRGKRLLHPNYRPDWLNIAMEQFVIDTVLIEPRAETECTSLHTSYIYSEIGISKLYADMSIAFDLKDPNDARITMRYQDKVTITDLTLNFSANDIQKSVTNRQVPFNKVQFNSTIDSEFAALFNAYCAKKLDISVDEFLDEVVTSPEFFYYSFGYNLGEQASYALAKSMTGGQVVQISATPTNRIKKQATASTLDRKSIIRELNLKVSLDDKPVAIETDTFNDFPDLTTSLASQEQQAQSTPRVRQKNFVDTSIASLPNLIKKHVIIERKGDKSNVKGRIKSYADDTVLVEIRRFGGQATYEIHIDDIGTVQVLR